MKRIAQSALVCALAACSTEYVYVHSDPGTGDDGGVALDDAGNRIVDAAPPSNGALAANVAISDIAVFQGVKVTLVKAGKPSSSKAPVVANRDALLRVYATPDTTYKPHALTAYLTITSSGGPLSRKDTKTISSSWSEASSASLFEFLVPAANLTTDAEFSVKIIDPSASGGATGSSPAQYPNDGSQASLSARSSGNQVKIHYFPLVTNNLTPPTDAAHIATIKDLLYELYPVSAVEFTVMPPVKYPGSAPAANGANWGNMLNWFLQKRQTDNPPDDVYYYGGFTPASSFASFCGNGCVAGLSSLAQSVQDVFARASIGLGYSGSQTSTDTAFTAAHEIGHAHGRSHAPCGPVQGIDNAFPYSNASIGVWGYGLLDKTFIDPAAGHDMMGYCPDHEWISDYTYKALFDRIAAVNGANFIYPKEQLEPRDYAWVNVAGDGTLTWGATVTVSRPVYGDPHTVSYLSGDGKTIKSVTGSYYSYDHLGGGYMLVPVGPPQAVRAIAPDFSAIAVSTLIR